MDLERTIGEHQEMNYLSVRKMLEDLEHHPRTLKKLLLISMARLLLMQNYPVKKTKKTSKKSL